MCGSAEGRPASHGTRPDDRQKGDRRMPRCAVRRSGVGGFAVATMVTRPTHVVNDFRKSSGRLTTVKKVFSLVIAVRSGKLCDAPGQGHDSESASGWDYRKFSVSCHEVSGPPRSRDVRRALLAKPWKVVVDGHGTKHRKNVRHRSKNPLVGRTQPRFLPARRPGHPPRGTQARWVWIDRTKSRPHFGGERQAGETG